MAVHRLYGNAGSDNRRGGGRGRQRDSDQRRTSKESGWRIPGQGLEREYRVVLNIMEFFKLNTGDSVPALCFGPGMLTRGMKNSNSFCGKVKNKFIYLNKEYAYRKAIISAMKCGYRFIDYSATYGREDLIASAIKKTGLERQEFWLTTRISNAAQYSGKVRESFFQSLKRYNSDYIDVLMFHWPVTSHYLDTWREMLKLKEEGYCRILGVANCHSHHLDFLIKETGIVPSINQIEVHPLFTQKPLLSYCKKNNIVVEAYTPLARFDDRLIRLPLLKRIALKYRKTIPQIILRWHIQNGIIPVFRSMNYQRQQENYNIFDFELTNNEIQQIDSININSRLRYDPDNCDFTIL